MARRSDFLDQDDGEVREAGEGDQVKQDKEGSQQPTQQVKRRQ